MDRPSRAIELAHGQRGPISLRALPLLVLGLLKNPALTLDATEADARANAISLLKVLRLFFDVGAQGHA